MEDFNLNYEEALNFIHGRPRMRKVPTLNRMTLFLEKIGNPQQFIEAVHVAGTNGKGSTIAFLEQMIQDTGRTVGTFTSPFLIQFNERIAVNGNSISNQEVIKLVEQIKPIVDEMDQTQLGGPLEFELVTAMMFLYFKNNPVDIVLIEVGIGGRFDSTNVFTPILSVITNVDWDHMEILGDTLAQIAYQKAGIIKPRKPVIVGVENQEVLDVLIKESQKQSAPLKAIKRDFEINTKNEFTNQEIKISNLKSGLLGTYQINNLAVATEAMILISQMLEWQVDFEQLKQSAQRTRWAGRMELVQKSPDIILDGAHNLPGIEALKQSIKDYWPNQTVYVLAAILEDKLFNPMLENLIDLKQVHVTLTSFNGPGKRSVVEAIELNEELKQKVRYVKSWQHALKEIKKEAREQDVIIITGSLYFISEVRPTIKNKS